MASRKFISRTSNAIRIINSATLLLSTAIITYTILTISNHSKQNKIHRPEIENTSYHVVVTTDGSIYQRWQMRIMYYWYRKVKAMEGSGDMGGFTRLLHSGQPDDLMDEIPTFVVDPIPDGLDQDYVVLNRPWAFVQWLNKAKIIEDYILMAEPDHIFVRPMPNLAIGGYPAGHVVNYMNPQKDGTVLRKFYPQEKGPLKNIQTTGNSPVIISKTTLEKIAPAWMIIALRMKDNPETYKALDWILEMYAYAIASALYGIEHVLYEDMIAEPPYDPVVGRSFIIHYTYDYIYPPEETGLKSEWIFDKRNYQNVTLPRNISLPPPGAHESMHTLIMMMNDATANIPKWD